MPRIADSRAKRFDDLAAVTMVFHGGDSFGVRRVGIGEYASVGCDHRQPHAALPADLTDKLLQFVAAFGVSEVAFDRRATNSTAA